ncbi:hypothetical protein BV20DRAFT_560788 [Pilatotrama ljubarskyi]|nr:hypothetical protein BV20DRAFT_560788 [Pilatotrama ljubarskyi]
MSTPTVFKLSREVITIICRLLIPSNSDRIPCHVLSVVLSCRFLSEPMLDVLWEVLPHIGPLMRTLPADLYGLPPPVRRSKPIAPSNGYGLQYMLLRDPVPRDFERLAVYSPRIKWLNQGPFYAPVEDPWVAHRITAEVWRMLLQHGPRPLLPNLKCLSHSEDGERHPTLRIRWLQPGGPPTILPTDLLLGPRLKEVSVAQMRVDLDPKRIDGVVKSVVKFSPHVESLAMSLALTGCEGGRPLLEGLEICALISLTELDIPDVELSYPSLLAVASLPSLRTLACGLDLDLEWWDDYDSFQHGGSAGPLFPRLKSLELQKGRRSSYASIAAFLKLVSSSSLTSLRLSGYDDLAPPTPCRLRSLCKSIVEHPSRRSLRELHITFGWRGSQSSPEFYFPEDIAPLLQLSALRTVEIAGRCRVMVDDAFLEDVASAWPDIEVLGLCWQSPNPIDANDSSYEPPPLATLDCPKITFRGLVHFVRRCPKLTELDLAVDMRAIPECDAAMKAGAPSVAHLGLYGSVVTDPMRVASALSLIFPALKQIYAVSPSDVWDRVRKDHKWMARIRAQERRWTQKDGRCLREPDSRGEGLQAGEERDDSDGERVQ